MDPAYKSLDIEAAGLSFKEDGHSFTGYVACFGTKDHGGDVIRHGAFDATLKARPRRPLLWQHDTREPIGVERSLAADDKGLLGAWELVDTQRGQDAYKLLKAGAVSGMSIGYVPGDVTFEGKARHIATVDLLESSVVTLPMNEMAIILAVKAAAEDLDAPFGDMLARVTDALDHAIAEAKALHARRADEHRTFSDTHREKLNGLLAQAEAALGLRGLLAPDQAGADAGDWTTRLELARRRLGRMAA